MGGRTGEASGKRWKDKRREEEGEGRGVREEKSEGKRQRPHVLLYQHIPLYQHRLPYNSCFSNICYSIIWFVRGQNCNISAPSSSTIQIFATH